MGEEPSLPSQPSADWTSISNPTKSPPRFHNRNFDPDIVAAWKSVKAEIYKVTMWFGWGLVLGTLGCTAIAIWAVLIRDIVK